jgi:Acetyltransferase (GNAT) domain
MRGYNSQEYAHSLAEYGIPLELTRCKGWVLKRSIPGNLAFDAMGCYPLFACQDWSKLALDLQDLSEELVALSVVTDPFGQYDAPGLQQTFVDVVKPFKQHFVIDLHRPHESYVSKHHLRNASKARQTLRVEKCDQPALLLDEWTALYDTLIERHNITGITKFSRTSFAKQLQVPGLVAIRAVHAGATVGMLLWFLQGDVGYYHLGAYSPLGYELRASFALFWFAIEYFSASGLRWLNIGAGAGLGSDEKDGLTRFKKGWSTGTRTAYFCGRIFDHARYREIAHAKGIAGTDYFPAYRLGEF